MTLAGFFLLTALAAPLVCAGILIPICLRTKLSHWKVSLVAPVVSALLLLMAAGISRHAFVVTLPWVSSLDVPLRFLADPLSFFFGFIAVAMGAAVLVYGQAYFAASEEDHVRFYVYTLLFMAAMLATVFGENLIGIAIFWELTGIVSFLLIGYDRTFEPSRRNATIALLTTAGTGLVMVAGMVLLGFLAQTFSVQTLLTGPLVPTGGLFTLAFVMIAVGAFGKSAQFPFHFWLPRAMVAPVPVSAYLHSAAMVNLGIFLLARMMPVFSGLRAWPVLLITIGGISMLGGAVMALRNSRIKAILAYATIGYLGYLIVYLGSAPQVDFPTFAVQVGGHVLYKATLFMVAGCALVITGSDDLAKLRGLYRSMPLVGIAAVLTAATMAALPGTWGFWAKELFFNQLTSFQSQHPTLGFFAAAATLISSACMTAVALRIVWPVFFGRSAHQTPSTPFQLQVVPITLTGVLAIATLGLGWHEQHLLTHGIWKIGVVSGLPLLVGVAMFYGLPWDRLTGPIRWPLFRMPSPSKWELGHWIGFHQPAYYLRYVLGFILAVLAVLSLSAWRFVGVHMGPVPALMWVATALMLISIIGTLKTGPWLPRIVALSAIGAVMVFYFMLYSAPDLALTQLLIEVITLILMLALLARFPQPAEPRGK